MIKRVVVSAGLIRAPEGHPQAGRILMTRRLADVHLAHAWEFPGGKVELGEDPIDALHRELKEELNIEVCNPTIYAVGHHLYLNDHDPSQGKDVVLLIYECLLLKGDPQRIGVSDFSWLTSKEVCGLPLPPADEEVLARLQGESERDHS